MPDADLAQIWVYLSASPLLGLTITLIAYLVGLQLYGLVSNNPLMNPVAIAILVVIAYLLISDTAFETYFEGAQFVHFLLGPATVGFAVPLYRQLHKLKTMWLPISIAVVTGVATSSLSAVWLARLFGASAETVMSFAPKSITTPIAMGVSEQLGGLPSLTAVLVISTGIIGAVLGSTLFTLLNIKDDTVKGISLGLNAHGIGTAQAFQMSAEMGAFSALGMALMAFVGPIVIPWLISLSGM